MCIPALDGIKLSRVIGSIDRINWPGGEAKTVVKVFAPSAVASLLSLPSIADEAKPIKNK